MKVICIQDLLTLDISYLAGHVYDFEITYLPLSVLNTNYFSHRV